ncbi:MAG: LemA protein, partial [Fimbriimonadaceae bacterium]|nr:LemA protein [Fimbriimonadaceae bacterium]
MNGLYIFAAVLVALLVVLIWQYNGLVKMRQLGKNAWADVDVYLKRRAELIPNLVAAVKGYTGYEQSTLERVVQARSNAMSAPSLPQRAAAEGDLTRGITQVYALAEAYPDLKANQSFLDLQQQLSGSEKSIADARQYYNAVVRDYNTMLEAFPSGVFASMFGFKPMEFFEVDT